MGFRSNFITQSYVGVKIPQWFIDKYPDYFYQQSADDKKTFAIAQLYESKFYDKFSDDERILDIQKVLNQSDLDKIILILLHECGGITRLQIEKNSIKANEPINWKEVTHVNHDYCYGCSDL